MFGVAGRRLKIHQLSKKLPKEGICGAGDAKKWQIA